MSYLQKISRIDFRSKAQKARAALSLLLVLSLATANPLYAIEIEGIIAPDIIYCKADFSESNEEEIYTSFPYYSFILDFVDHYSNATPTPEASYTSFLYREMSNDRGEEGEQALLEYAYFHELGWTIGSFDFYDWESFDCFVDDPNTIENVVYYDSAAATTTPGQSVNPNNFLFLAYIALFMNASAFWIFIFSPFRKNRT